MQKIFKFNFGEDPLKVWRIPQRILERYVDIWCLCHMDETLNTTATPTGLHRIVHVVTYYMTLLVEASRSEHSQRPCTAKPYVVTFLALLSFRSLFACVRRRNIHQLFINLISFVETRSSVRCPPLSPFIPFWPFPPLVPLTPDR
jgi:hypothetical protein